MTPPLITSGSHPSVAPELSEAIAATLSTLLNPSDTFPRRHIGPNVEDVKAMLDAIGCDSLEDLVEQTVPASIRLDRPMKLDEPLGEFEVIQKLHSIAKKNRVVRSLIGMGYSDTITPPVIQRNILENPGWYTQYTPYQAEISQGRMEALINFQTMVSDLTGLPLASASLLDEGTAAAEAMAMCKSVSEGAKNTFIVASDCHPQTIAVVRTRAESLGIRLLIVDCGTSKDGKPTLTLLSTIDNPQSTIDATVDLGDACGILVQYPTTDGKIVDYSALVTEAHAAGSLVVFAADILALTLLKSPGEFGADIAVGCTQRFGVPLGFGGPHAAYLSTKTEYARKMPGRIIGVSRDASGKPAYRLTLQTREQHIRRDRATSNICTAQVLLAVMAGMYAVYHGPTGLKRIAQRTHLFARAFAAGVERLGHSVVSAPFFDTVKVRLNQLPSSSVVNAALASGFNLRRYSDDKNGEYVSASFDETTTRADVESAIAAFAGGSTFRLNIDELAGAYSPDLSIETRKTPYLEHPVFNRYHSETELLRYIFKLMSRDLSLAQSMIPLGSCTMKLNATSEMLPVTWPEFGRMHPYAPADQTVGYAEMFKQLEGWLAEITGFAAVWLQPNAGSQGEYAGLLAIRAYHHARKEAHRDVCLIPTSAHGTNPASAIIAGMKVVTVACDDQGNVDISDLQAKASLHQDNLAALMVTYPSTHGVFESGIKDICKIVHDLGGQVYMDGANMNAQVALCSPGDIGADVCHLNLHKTFCIPHGGGGPGMGPIGVAKHLAQFIPDANAMRSIVECGMSTVGNAGNRSSPQSTIHNSQSNSSQLTIGTVSAAPYGSASILPISWVYIAAMGASGLRRATQIAILNANYMASRLKGHYDILYTGANGRVAHEFVVDCRGFEQSTNVKVEDIAKRLMDYGYHAPTMSWPVPGTLMIEPTESESRAELDRFCDALIQIREEIRSIEQGKLDQFDNPLKHAPHTAAAVTSDAWTHKYGREQAAYPAAYLHDFKFWPTVARVDNPYGDRNLVCTCLPMEEYEK